MNANFAGVVPPPDMLRWISVVFPLFFLLIVVVIGLVTGLILLLNNVPTPN